MAQEQFKKIETTEERISKEVSSALKLIAGDKNYHLDNINEEELAFSLIKEFNSLPENPSIRVGFMNVIEEKVKIMVLKINQNETQKKFLNAAAKAHEIDENIPEIAKVA